MSKTASKTTEPYVIRWRHDVQKYCFRLMRPKPELVDSTLKKYTPRCQVIRLMKRMKKSYGDTMNGGYNARTKIRTYIEATTVITGAE